MYTYLAGNVGRVRDSEGAFRALKRGYIHRASGRLEKIEVNVNHPEYCHVRSKIKASMKDISYVVYSVDLKSYHFHLYVTGNLLVVHMFQPCFMPFLL